jgi:hypothetical protein
MTISSGLSLMFGRVHKCKQRMAKTAKWHMGSFRSNNLILVTAWLDGFETDTSTVDTISTCQAGKWVYILVKVVMEE